METHFNDNVKIRKAIDPENGDTRLLKATEINELIDSRPSFTVRWGISILLAVFLVLFIATWFICYPDIVFAKATLSSINAPKEVIVKTPGKLIKLFVKNEQVVVKSEVLGFIESTANHSDVINLSETLDTLLAQINQNHTDEVLKFSTTRNNLGELQIGFQTFAQSLQQFTNYLKNGFYLKKKKMLTGDLNYLKQLHTELVNQRNLITEDVILSDSTFQANQFLKEEKVISPFDYRNEKSKLISKQLSLPQISTSIITNKALQHEKLKEISELENEIQQQKIIFIQSLSTLRSQVADWKKKYLIVAPIAGKVSFATFIQEDQELRAEQLICYINSDSSSFYAETLIPQYNFGKIKSGQNVLLKFAAYPWQEFGFVRGKVELINSVPTDSGFLARVSFPNGLITNFKKPIQYRTGLFIEVEIITKDVRLIERFINTLRKSI